MLTVWRRLRYLDPGLPLDLLPARRKGVPAAVLFGQLDEALRPVAHRHGMRVIRDGR